MRRYFATHALPTFMATSAGISKPIFQQRFEILEFLSWTRAILEPDGLEAKEVAERLGKVA
ncbi:MAG: hypothetical protein LBM19_02355 [Holosporales bacterium]|jgi:hypothetical protein|nr:hypothetical protein [Holosporales bacterium]